MEDCSVTNTKNVLMLLFSFAFNLLLLGHKVNNFFRIGALTRIERDLDRRMSKNVDLHEARLYQLLRFIKPEKQDGFVAHLCEWLLKRCGGGEGLREMPEIETYILKDDRMHSGRQEEFFATVEGWEGDDEKKRLKRALGESHRQLKVRAIDRHQNIHEPGHANAILGYILIREYFTFILRSTHSPEHRTLDDQVIKIWPRIGLVVLKMVSLKS